MRGQPPLTATIDWSAGVATVAVRGDLDHATCRQLRERLAWVIGNRPRRLVLDVGGVADGCCEQVIAVIAAARQQLPPGCLLEVRSASPAVRSVLDIAGWNRVRVARGHQLLSRARPGDGGQSGRHGTSR